MFDRYENFQELFLNNIDQGIQFLRPIFVSGFVLSSQEEKSHYLANSIMTYCFLYRLITHIFLAIPDKLLKPHKIKIPEKHLNSSKIYSELYNCKTKQIVLRVLNVKFYHSKILQYHYVKLLLL